MMDTRSLTTRDIKRRIALDFVFEVVAHLLAEPSLICGGSRQASATTSFFFQGPRVFPIIEVEKIDSKRRTKKLHPRALHRHVALRIRQQRM